MLLNRQGCGSWTELLAERERHGNGGPELLLVLPEAGRQSQVPESAFSGPILASKAVSYLTSHNIPFLELFNPKQSADRAAVIARSISSHKANLDCCSIFLSYN